MRQKPEEDAFPAQDSRFEIGEDNFCMVSIGSFSQKWRENEKLRVSIFLNPTCFPGCSRTLDGLRSKGKSFDQDLFSLFDLH
jgi:hypothetical protein